MKRKILSLALILMLGAMLVFVTGCGSEESESDSDSSESSSSETDAISGDNALEDLLNELITTEVEESGDITVSQLNSALGDDYKIVGVYSSSGLGVSSLKEYIDPDTSLALNEANASLVSSIDYIFIYDVNSSKEYRVRIYRQSNPPYADVATEMEK